MLEHFGTIRAGMALRVPVVMAKGSVSRLAVPLSLSRLGLFGLPMADSLLLARADIDQLAFFAVAAQPQHALGVVGQGLLAGLPAYIATARTGTDEASSWFRAGLAICVLASAIMVGLLANGDWVLSSARQPDLVVEGGGAVLSILAWGLPAILIFACAALVLEATARPLLPLWVVVIANVVNVPLNLILIGGVPGHLEPWGAVGCAIGDTALRWLMAIALLMMAWPTGCSRASSFVLPLRTRIRELARIGVPVGIGTMFEVAGFMTLLAFAGVLGSNSLAQYQVARNFYQLPFIVATAIGISTSIHLAQAISAGARRHARRIVWTSTFKVLMFTGVCGCLLAAFPTEAGLLFSGDEAFVARLRPVLIMTGLVIVLDGLQGFLAAAIRGVREGFVPSLIQLIAFWAVAVPVSYTLAFSYEFGLLGVFGGLSIGLALAMLLIFLRLINHHLLSSPPELGRASVGAARWDEAARPDR